ncbi:MAG: MBL fold metallo-hydrolase [Clostridia bacterium]|nr:MBL fold metallo-hydrolase [Clostridia bacterium]
MDIHFFDHNPAMPKDWRGGAQDCAFLFLPEGKTMLVDTGFDFTASRTLNWLASIGAPKAIDVLVISHYHSDHIGGFRALLEAGYTFGVIYSPVWGLKNCNIHPDYFQALKDYGLRETRLRAGDSFTLGGVFFQVLWPLPDAPDSPDYDRDDYAANIFSLLVKMTWGNFTALLTGDSDGISQDWLLSRCPEKLRGISLLKMMHHGSSYSTPREAFMALTAPLVTVTMAPAYWCPVTRGYLDAYGRERYLTGKEGHIRIATDGKTMQAFTEKGGQGQLFTLD